MANKNPRVYMDVWPNRLRTERMIFELFYDTAPFAAENFRALCTGEKGLSPTTRKPLWYQNTYFLKVPKGGTYVKGGAFCYKDGTGGESIYGSNFPSENAGSWDEPNELKMRRHDERGLLSIRKEDCTTRGSHFIITLKPDDSLNSSHVVFGKLVEGYEALKDIEEWGFRRPCRIIYCGQYEDVESSSHGDMTDSRLTYYGMPFGMHIEDNPSMEDIEDSPSMEYIED